MTGRERDVRDADGDELRFKRLIDAAPAMIWMSDAEDRPLYFNKSWLAFTGRTLTEELSGGWLANIHPDDAVRCRESYEDCFRRRVAFRMECRLQRQGGEFRWILATGAPRYNTGGQFVGYVGSCTDITAVRNAYGQPPQDSVSPAGSQNSQVRWRNGAQLLIRSLVWQIGKSFNILRVRGAVAMIGIPLRDMIDHAHLAHAGSRQAWEIA